MKRFWRTNYYKVGSEGKGRNEKGKERGWGGVGWGGGGGGYQRGTGGDGGCWGKADSGDTGFGDGVTRLVCSLVAERTKNGDSVS